jgi:hypothetical protein
MRLISLALLTVLSVAAPCLAQTGKEKLPEEFAAMRSALCDKPADFDETGCKVCPKFTAEDHEGAPLRGGLGVYSILFGSFTSVGRTEALLNSNGCFSHAEGFASALLFRKEQGSWRRLIFLHRDGPMGLCQKISGQGDQRDLLICNYEDYGAGAISLIAFDAYGNVKAQKGLVQTWLYPGWRSTEKQKHCSTVSADIKKVSFNSVEISVFLNSFDVDPPINCFDESDSTTSKISNSKKIETVAVFTRRGDDFIPDENTKQLLSEIASSR